MKLTMGPRGEGWFLLQLLFFVLIFLAPRGWALHPSPGVQLAGGALLLTGTVFASGGLWTLGRNLTPFPRPKQGNELVTHGPYRLVRHPIYTGILFASSGFSLLLASLTGLLLTAGLLLLFELKSRREERWLAELHPDYAAYQRRTKRLLPFLW